MPRSAMRLGKITHMDAITLCKATETDAATLAALHVAVWHETYTVIKA